MKAKERDHTCDIMKCIGDCWSPHLGRTPVYLFMAHAPVLHHCRIFLPGEDHIDLSDAGHILFVVFYCILGTYVMSFIPFTKRAFNIK